MGEDKKQEGAQEQKDRLLAFWRGRLAQVHVICAVLQMLHYDKDHRGMDEGYRRILYTIVHRWVSVDITECIDQLTLAGMASEEVAKFVTECGFGIHEEGHVFNRISVTMQVLSTFTQEDIHQVCQAWGEYFDQDASVLNMSQGQEPGRWSLDDLLKGE